MALIYPSPKPKPRTYRSYKVDGESWPSVTAVLSIIRKPFLETWRGRLGNSECDRIASESAHLGTRVHDACARIARGETFKPDLDLIDYVIPYRRWFAEHVSQVVAVERFVVHRGHRYAGTTDLVAVLRDDSAYTVVDLKVSNYESQEWKLQTAAYGMALDSEGETIQRRVIVRIGKGPQAGTVEEIEYTEHDEDFQAFLHALGLFRHLEGA